MEETFPHLLLQREMPVNERRAGSYPPKKPPNDIAGHGRGLLEKLANAKERSADDVGGEAL